MFELTINDKVYQFHFGMGFLREINRSVTTSVDNMPGVKRGVGLSYAVASIIDGDVEKLTEVLDLANKGQEPRITKKELDQYVEDEGTDIDTLFESVIDFLSTSNATKRETMKIVAAMEETKKN